jgi:hypothetical protein
LPSNRKPNWLGKPAADMRAEANITRDQQPIVEVETALSALAALELETRGMYDALGEVIDAVSPYIEESP